MIYSILENKPILYYIFALLNQHADEILALLCCITIPLKIYLIRHLIKERHNSSQTPVAFWFLLLILISSITEDSMWILFYFNQHIVPINPLVYRFLKTISWAFCVVYVHSLTLFITNLFDRKFALSVTQKLLLGIGCILSLVFIILGIYSFQSISCESLFQKMVQCFSAYAVILTFICIVTTLYRLARKNKLPKILKKQLLFIVSCLIIPQFICFLLQILPFLFSSWNNNASLEIPQTILITYALWLSCKRIMQLRFLNIKKHVESSKSIVPIYDFRKIIEQIAVAKDLRELPHICKRFLEQLLSIPPHRIQLVIRNTNQNIENTTSLQQPEHIIEPWLFHSQGSEKITFFLSKHKIIIKDEIEFNNFYTQDDLNDSIIKNLSLLEADIFLPIYHNQKLVAYIIIQSSDRSSKLYNDLERDELIVFSSYLGSVIDLLHRRTLNSILEQEKKLTDELYFKHQEINQYRESLRSFLKEHHNQKIGILFYKNGKFSVGNEDANDLLHLNLNFHKGHPLVKDCTTVAQRVAQYNKPHSLVTQTIEGKQLVIDGIPNIDTNNVILLIHRPEISDLIKPNIDTLKNPSDWDYLLYLETTNSGQLISQLFPGDSDLIINFKTSLLKLALSKKAILLNMPEDDLMATVEILHHISLKQNLHKIDLQTKTSITEMAIKLFGINSLLGEQQSEPLLQQLDHTGTLFIKNIHLLDMENQHRLTQFIKYGTYSPYQSDKLYFSDVRIICSSNQDLTALAQEEKFCPELLNELTPTTIKMPSLLTMPDQDIAMIADTVATQAIKAQELNKFLKLSDIEKQKIIRTRPASIHELKQKVLQLLVLKTEKNHIAHETMVDTTLTEHDPELIRAAQLGKNALRDEQLMVFLWNKFKNQNKIATFLGVNRSSVNRRCKLYKLT